MTSANISDPEVIRTFRAHLAVFLKMCSAALGSRASELNRTRDWLRGEQLMHWKNQAMRREEAYQNARRLWLEAEAAVTEGMHGRGPGKPSSIEERIDMDRARRRRDEAEEKLALVRRWLVRLDQEGEPLMHACQGHDFDLRERGALALAQLDRLAERVQTYLDLPASAGGAAMPSVPGPGGDAPPADGAAGGEPCPR
jgi:hypothetical protein